jgi:hypothetical protein
VATAGRVSAGDRDAAQRDPTDGGTGHNGDPHVTLLVDFTILSFDVLNLKYL